MSAASQSSEKPLPPRPPNDDVYDAIVIGSGFGGSMVAHELVGDGRNVLMLEQGDWVERGPHN
jgi:choline dehydrogenase-like flavoprotein